MFAFDHRRGRALLAAATLACAGAGASAGCECGRGARATRAAGPTAAGGSTVAATARSGAPRSGIAGATTLTVPAGLRRVTAGIEPSGIAWVPVLDRYLIVSDDTGRKEDATNHAPWLFAVSRDGVLDGEPVPIVGVAALNDLEAICPGPGGTFFVTTSHSPDRKGRTGPDRAQLLQLAVAGRTLQVVGRVDLRTARAIGGGSWLAAAGLPADGRLDIEALAFRDGALFVGLKSPLTSGGEAVVMRLADAAGVLQGGTIPDGALTRFVAAPLEVETDGTPAREGISGMTFLADGSLVLLGNAPKGMPDDGGGALWRIAGPVAEGARASLLQRFPGLTPEGISLSAAGDSLVIVFDGDPHQPLWMQRPLPQ